MDLEFWDCCDRSGFLGFFLEENHSTHVQMGKLRTPVHLHSLILNYPSCILRNLKVEKGRPFLYCVAAKADLNFHFNHMQNWENSLVHLLLGVPHAEGQVKF